MRLAGGVDAPIVKAAEHGGPPLQHGRKSETRFSLRINLLQTTRTEKSARGSTRHRLGKLPLPGATVRKTVAGVTSLRCTEAAPGADTSRNGPIPTALPAADRLTWSTRVQSVLLDYDSIPT